MYENMELSKKYEIASTLAKDAVRFKELLVKNPPLRPGVGPKRKLELMGKQMFKCNLCKLGLEENNYDCDHKIPWCQSFDNLNDNLQIICLKCHRKNGSRTFGIICKNNSFKICELVR